MYYVC
jgi:hypothetical protein